MGMRKYLCRELDREGKGYITVENITDEIFSRNFMCIIIFGSILAICLTSLVCLIGELYNNGIIEEEGISSYMFLFIHKFIMMHSINLNNFVAGFSILGSFIIIILILNKLWGYVKTLKVIICPLKQK